MNASDVSDSTVEEDAGETQPVRLFALNGRIGRLRYIAYGVGMCFALYILGTLLVVAAAAAVPSLTGVVFALVGIAIVAVIFMLTIQRSHDFNATGWLSLLVLLPPVVLVFCFIPGTKGINRFGAPTPPNTMGVYITSVAVPLVVVLLGVVALSAFDDFGARAKISEVVMEGHALRVAVAEHYRQTKRLPSSEAELKEALPDSVRRYGRATLTADGVIVLTFSPNMGSIAGKTILLRPIARGDELEWNCTGGTLPRKYRPASCRGE